MKAPKLFAWVRNRVLADRPNRDDIRRWAKLAAIELDRAVVLPGILEIVDGPIFRALITALALEILDELEEAEARAQAKSASRPQAKSEEG